MKALSTNGKCIVNRNPDFSCDSCRSLTRGIFLSTPAQEISNHAIQNIAQWHKAAAVLRIAGDKEVVVFPEQGLRKNQHKMKSKLISSGTVSSRQVRPTISHSPGTCLTTTEPSLSLSLVTHSESATSTLFFIPRVSCKC